MKVSKKTGIALFVTTAVIMAVLIVFHKNPGPAADPGQELVKKIISCVVIAAACFAFIHWYDKFTGLPVELFQNRHLVYFRIVFQIIGKAQQQNLSLLLE